MRRPLTVTAILLFVLSGTASADTFHPDSSLTAPGELVVGGSTFSHGTTATATAGSTPIVSYIAYRVVPEQAVIGSLAGWCAVPGNPLGGVEYHVVGTRADGGIASDERVCVPITTAGVTPPPPPQPQPPTFAETWRAARLPQPTILTDPSTRGITGLDTRIWTAGTSTKSIVATVRGYRIVGTATLDHYTISVDGGPVQDAGSGHYTFETKGKHTIVIGAVWHGTATLTGPGLIAPITLPDIGTATLTSTRTYPVNEIRSVLQP